MKRNQNAGAAHRSTPTTVGGSSPQDQQFEERLRIAEHIVQVFRESGYSCELDDSHARLLSRVMESRVKLSQPTWRLQS
jgi:hypothetical protein